MPTPGIHRASSSSNRGSLLYHSADSEGVGATQQPETKATRSSSLLHWHKACALIVDAGVLGGEELGLPTDIRSHLIVRHIEGNASWLGFVMEIPRGVNSEDYGFGMCYSVNPLPTGKLEPARTYKLEVKFSLFGMEYSVEPVGSALLELLHGRENQFSVLEVHLGDNSDPRVSGFGMPFANSGHPSDAWINSGQPIIGKRTLLNILSQRTFRFVVESPADKVQASFVTERMHPPFSYPYDTQHHWDLRNYKTPNKAKGHTFNRVWQFESHNDHVAVMAQSEVQDAIWLHNAAQKIINYKFRAYFVMATSDSPWKEPVDFYAIVRLTPLFLKEYASALRCLISDEVLGLNIHDNDHGKSAARWPARVVHNPMTIDALSESSPALPSVNLLQLPQRHIKALMEEVLPSDRKRLCAYLSKAPLGFGLITGGPGFGKTTVLSVATLGMSITLGPILASAATDVATDNFAEHLNRISERFTRRLNESKRLDDSPAGRILVVRGYFEEDEIEAFQSLLEHPQMGDAAAPRSNSSYRAPWRLQLSLTFWLLVALRSPAVRPLHYEDNEEIHLLQSYLDHRGEFERLRNVAAGVISFEEYKNGRMVSPYVIKHLFQGILRHADILCTNPALSCNGLYAPWKKYVARGIAVDEAGSISRPDLYSLWGNTLLPCLLCGDDKQLAPRLMSFGQRDYLGNSVNRHEHDVTGSGWNPVQSKHALDFICGLVTNTKATPGEVFIITPYRASVEYIERQRKEPEYSAISAMAPATTIEDFQGRQGNIVILVTATTAASRSSPIFDVHHLSVMLSRQISGLVIFGDLEILSEFGRQKSKAKQAQANGKYVIAARRKKAKA
ncbi:hypothetical protein TrVFT333_004731 [Trichoderma virens FT-333]|nr:hypothetical protein TrVFT333_004731 [Trichoderma virens FT-333]